MQHIEIKPTESGYDILLDGQELKNVIALTLRMRAGEVPQIQIELVGLKALAAGLATLEFIFPQPAHFVTTLEIFENT